MGSREKDIEMLHLSQGLEVLTVIELRCANSANSETVVAPGDPFHRGECAAGEENSLHASELEQKKAFRCHVLVSSSDVVV